jgi:phosphoglycerate dehydrogenase-like enzyme
VGFEQLDELLPKADFVILAAALTPETHHLIDTRRLGLMKPTSYLINIARGGMVNTDDLIAALNSEVIAGAATDVTDPEPLPEGHRLWSAKNILITPHTADTNVQVIRLFSQRIDHNVRAWLAGTDFEGLVDPSLGY